jgi:hypothetical protein
MRRVGGRPTGSGRPFPSVGRWRPSPFPTATCLPLSLLSELQATCPTRMRTSQRRRRHGPRPNKTADKPSCAFAPCRQPLSRRPTELADGLALKEPAPPTARRGIRPNNSGPPLSDTSSETRRISGKLAGAQRENASGLADLAANSRHFLVGGTANTQFALALSTSSEARA